MSGDGVVGIFSSWDNQPVPEVAGALKLAERARGAGWHVRVGVALVYVPDQYRVASRELAKPAHLHMTVGVYMRRGRERGRAYWSCTDGRRWAFDTAQVNGERFGWMRSRKSEAPTILERIEHEQVQDHN